MHKLSNIEGGGLLLSFHGLEVLPFASNKAILLARNFYKNSILIT